MSMVMRKFMLLECRKGRREMFSVKQKRDIAEAVQKIIRATNHPELPEGEIQFYLKVNGAASWSWAEIRNNGAVKNPDVNPWNECQNNEFGACGILTCRAVTGQVNHSYCRNCGKIIKEREKNNG